MNNNRYESPFKFLIIIPIGIILIFFIVDTCVKYYNIYKYDKDVKEMFTDTLKQENLNTVDDYENFFKKEMDEKKYTSDDIDIEIIKEEDYYLLFAKTYYQSFVNQIIKNGNKTYYISLKGYYNEYKEVVVEDYEYDDYIEVDEEITNE